jgi:hypothetical protein
VDPQSARDHVGSLETSCCFRLVELPPELRDQWDTNMTAMFAELGVDLADRDQANAAFAGAYVLISLFAPVMIAPVSHLQNGTAIVRGLAEFTDSAAMVTGLEAWLREG